MQDQQDQPFHLGHRPELDAIRGIAIILVLFHHAGDTFVHGGQIGVDIFFVLSGFLITALLWQEYEREGRIDFRNFYIRRLLRLMPALLALLAVFGLFTLATKSGADLARSAEAIVFSALYLSDFALAFGYSSLGGLSHTWSLSIEEHFYLIYPLTLFLLIGRNRRTVIAVLAALIVVIVFQRTRLWGPASVDVHRVFYGFDTHADGLLVGCLLGLLVAWGWLPRIKTYVAIAGVVPLAAAIVFASWDSALYSYGLPIVNLSTAIALAFVLSSRPSWLAIKPLLWIGKVSYGLYLWHNLVFIVIRQRVTESRWGILIMGTLISIAIAALSFYILEKPFLKLKERFAKRRLDSETYEEGRVASAA